MKRAVFCLISLLTFASVSFAGPADHLVRGIYTLDGRWTLDFWPQGRNAVYGPGQMGGIDYRTVSATVPGNVELDLYEAGLAPKPELGGNTQLLRVYEGYQWRYSRDFASPIWGPDDSVVLRFAGIDCFAEVYVNGNHVGSADNMLIAHEFDVTDVLLPAGGTNHVEVYIRSSVEEGRKNLPPVFSNNWQRPECTSVRRAPHSYGWNIRDGWPIISDAVVDWYFSRKMAYYYIRNVQRNVCAMITDNADGSHAVVVTNDTRHPVQA